MSQVLANFSPAQVGINWGGIPFTGFAADTFITVSRNSPNSNTEVGADGSVGHTVVADKTGTIEVTLMQTSVTHRYLSAIQLAQDSSGDLYRANMTVVDPSGGFICKAIGVHIQEPPEVSLGGDQNEKTWTLFADRLLYTDAPAGFAKPAGEVSKIDDFLSGIQEASEALEDLFS